VADQAIIRAGGAKVPVNDMQSAREIAYLLRDSGAAVALADEGMAEAARAAGVPTVITVGPEWTAALAGAPTGGPPEVEVAESDVGLIMYTGGTTGRQKGVVHTQRRPGDQPAGPRDRDGTAGRRAAAAHLAACRNSAGFSRTGPGCSRGAVALIEARFRRRPRAGPDRARPGHPALHGADHDLPDARRRRAPYRGPVLAAHHPLRGPRRSPWTAWRQGPAPVGAGVHAALRADRGAELPDPAHP